jgi:hypothetical protein
LYIVVLSEHKTVDFFSKAGFWTHFTVENNCRRRNLQFIVIISL